MHTKKGWMNISTPQQYSKMSVQYNLDEVSESTSLKLSPWACKDVLDTEPSKRAQLKGNDCFDWSMIIMIGLGDEI
jgi:hypothetical protein